MRPCWGMPFLPTTQITCCFWMLLSTAEQYDQCSPRWSTNLLYCCCCHCSCHSCPPELPELAAVVAVCLLSLRREPMPDDQVELNRGLVERIWTPPCLLVRGPETSCDPQKTPSDQGRFANKLFVW